MAKIDSRGPRFSAGGMSALLLVGTFLAAIGSTGVSDPGFLVLTFVALLFAWSLASPTSQPVALFYRVLVQPRLAPPVDFEDPRQLQFAQGVGLFVVGLGLLLHLFTLPWALVVTGAMAFMAAFLNAVFGFCLGCELYLLLSRMGFVGRKAS